MPRQGLHPPCWPLVLEASIQALVQKPGKRVMVQGAVKEPTPTRNPNPNPKSNSVQRKDSPQEQDSVEESDSLQESVQAAERPPFGTS